MQQAPYLAMPVPFYPSGSNNVLYGSLGHNIQPPSSNNASVHNGPLLQMKPPVMPEIAVETSTNYVAWSKYPEETIRDRTVRSGAFVDGFGAALICFKMLDCRRVSPARCPACNTDDQFNLLLPAF